MAKAQHICRQHPANVILGGSRAELGINTQHPAWKHYPGVTYDIGLAGTGIWEMNKTLEHSYYASGQLKMALVNLDFLMFNRNLEDVVFDTVVIGFDPKRLMLSPKDSCSRIIKYDLNNLIGYQAFKNSLESVIRYLNIVPSTHVDYRRDGRMRFTFRTDHDIKQYTQVSQSKKYKTYIPNQAYDQQYGQEIAFVNKTWRAGANKRYCFTRTDGSHSTFEDYRNMLVFARKHHIELKFIISPIHANMMIALQEAGLWIQYEDWKRNLVKINEEVANQYHLAPFKIWDFSGFNAITTVLREDLFSQYYWEPSHFKERVGDMMLDIVLGNKKSKNDFGVLITKKNIEQHLNQILLAGKKYASNDYVLHLKDAIAAEMLKQRGANCGFANEMLYKASETADSSLEKKYLNLAFETYKKEKQRFNKRGVPYQENNFLKQYQLALQGKLIGRPLNTWEEYQTRANQFLAQNDYKHALQDLTAAIKLCPLANAALFYQRGSTYVFTKQYTNAIKDFSAGIKLLPKNVTLYYQRGNAFLELKQYTQALTDFSSGLKLDPKNKSLQKLYKQTIAFLNSAVILTANNPSHLNERG